MPIAQAAVFAQVQFPGARGGVAELLQQADTFVRPSLTEGLSLAVLEAMATGLAVVATRTTGAEEVMTDELDGVVVPPGDTAALAAALANVVGDPGFLGVPRRGGGATRTSV